MIQLTVITYDGIMAIRVAEMLVDKNLVITANLFAKVQQCSKKGKEVFLENRYMLTAITKGSLFNTIENRLKAEFPAEIFELSSVPVLNMNWELSDNLINEDEL
ncbi:MAG: hypothetical protein ACKVTZ_14000 [Bacteroidia bacterium]